MTPYKTNGIEFSVQTTKEAGRFRGWFICPVCAETVTGDLKDEQESAEKDGMMCAYTHSRIATHRYIGPPLQDFGTRMTADNPHEKKA